MGKDNTLDSEQFPEGVKEGIEGYVPGRIERSIEIRAPPEKV